MADVNGLDPVPMFIADKALHSADVVRGQINQLSNGAEGVTGSGSLKVSATGPLSAQVQISTGGGLILNRSAGGSNQTYSFRSKSGSDGISKLDIASTGGSVRSDAIVIRVEDPQFSPWTPYATLEEKRVGPYVFPRVIPNVSSSLTDVAGLPAQYQGQSLILLARVDMPANKVNVDPTYINDLRKIALPREKSFVRMSGPTAESSLTSTVEVTWPDYSPTITVPSWAVGADIVATLSSVGQRNGSTQGYLTARIGAHRSADILFDLDAPETGGSRHTLVVGGGWADIRDIAGQTVALSLRARRTNVPADPGNLVTVAGTQVIYQVTFYEAAA